MMTLTIEQQATRVMKKLRHSGCHIVGALKTPRSAIINIEYPTHSMMASATAIRQTLMGTPSMVYTMNLDGCVVSWTQGGNTCPMN
jgi:hypothetical protein